MSDLYVEHLIKRKTPGYLNVIKIGLMALIVASALLTLFIPFLILLPILLGVLTYVLIRRWNVEYEYFYVNGEMDIDVIMSAAKRKRKFSCKVSELEVMAPLGFSELKAFDHKNLKKYDFTSGEEGSDVYEMILNRENDQIRVAFEPNKQIIEGMKLMAPRKVLLKSW